MANYRKIAERLSERRFTFAKLRPPEPTPDEEQKRFCDQYVPIRSLRIAGVLSVLLVLCTAGVLFGVIFARHDDPNVMWLRVSSRNGQLMVAIGNATLIFDEIPYPCAEDFRRLIRVGGVGEEAVSIGNLAERQSRSCADAHLTLRQAYRNGVCRFVVNGIEFTLTEAGTVLLWDGRSKGIKIEDRVIRVGKNGPHEVRPYSGPKQPWP
jgi:hypothetical protein